MSKKRINIALFTGTIVLNRDEFTVRQLYVTERLKHLVNYPDLDITVFCPDGVSEEVRSLGCRFVTYRMIRRKHFRQLSVLFFSFFKLYRVECDILHVYSEDFAILIRILQLVRGKKFKILFEPMGPPLEELDVTIGSSPYLKYFIPVKRWNTKWFFNNSSGVLVYTNQLANHLSKSFKIPMSSFHVSFPGCDHMSYNVSVKEMKMLKSQHNLSGKKIIVYTGTLSQLHGPLDLLEAMSAISLKLPEAHLLLVGDGPLYQKVNDYIKKNLLGNVTLIGRVPFNEVKKYISIADVLVIPHPKSLKSQIDAPTKLFEYLASGKPIVAFKLDIISEIGGGCVMLAEPNNSDSLADCIILTLKNDKISRKRGDNCKDQVDRYSWYESTKSTYKTYRSLVKKL